MGLACKLPSVEVLSPSTERDDFFAKLPAYQSIPSLQEIPYVETERRGDGLPPSWRRRLGNS